MKSKADNNFHLQLRDGEFPLVTKRIEGVPNKLTPVQRRQYQPYLNVNDERRRWRKEQVDEWSEVPMPEDTLDSLLRDAMACADAHREGQEDMQGFDKWWNERREKGFHAPTPIDLARIAYLAGQQAPTPPPREQGEERK